MTRVVWLSIFLLMLFSVQIIAQKSEKLVVRSVLFMHMAIGRYGANPDLANSTQSRLGNLDMDNFLNIYLPYNNPVGIGEYLNDFRANKLPYCYPDSYVDQLYAQRIAAILTSDTGKQSFTDLARVDTDSLNMENDTWICNRTVGGVAKMWIINGEWEEYTLTEKPHTISGIMPRSLVYDQYKVYMLKKVLSIEPIKSVESKNNTLVATKIGGIISEK